MATKEVRLYPLHMTQGTALDNLLSANGTGEDYRTVSDETMNIGTIAFDNKLSALSKACQINKVRLEFAFRHTNTLLPSGVILNLQPRFVNSYYTSGNIITINSYESVGTGGSCQTTSSSYHNESIELASFEPSATGYIGYDKPLAVHMSTKRGSSMFSTEAYLKNLSAVVEYVPRCLVQFYDENGSLINEYNFESGYKPKAPEGPEKEGYYFAGWKNGSVIYPSGTDLMECDDKDIAYTAFYFKNPIIHGSITEGEGEALNEDICIEYGSDYTINFKPATGYYIKDVIIDGVSKGEIFSYTFKGATKDHIVEVQFSKYCVITIPPYKNGKIEYGLDSETELNTVPEDGIVLNLKESEVNRIYFSSTPDEGYEESCIFHQYNSVNQYESSTNIEYIFGVCFISDYWEYTLTVTYKKIVLIVYKEQSVGGLIEGVADVEYGKEAQYTITPDDHYIIKDIFLDSVSVLSDVTFKGTAALYSLRNVTEHHIISAEFQRVTCLTFDVGKNGSISGDTVINYGASTYCTISANEGYSIDKIYVNGELHHQVTLVESSYQVYLSELTEDVTIKATFTNDIASLIVTQPAEGGYIYGSENGNYVSGSPITLNAYPEKGWYLSSWSNDERDEIITFNITENTALTAGFGAYEYKIETAVESGKGKVEPESLSANINDKQIFKAVPDDGYVFSHWEDGSTDAERQYTVVESATIKAYFVKGWYEITASGEGGTVTINGTPDNEGKYEFESEVTLKAIPDEGYYFEVWSDDVASDERTITVPAGGANYTAKFKKYQFEVEIECGEGCEEITESRNVEYGDSLTVNVKSANGYKLKDILLDGKSVYEEFTLTKDGGRYELTNIRENHKIEISFSERRYNFSRKLIDYYPPVIQRILDFIELTNAQQPLVGQVWDAVSLAYENQFIDDATEEGVIGWEKDYGITPQKTETLKDRKQRLKAMWVPSPRYTYEWLVRWLKVACNDENIVPPDIEDYTLIPYIPIKADFKNVIEDMRRYVPSNIYIKPKIRFAPIEHKHYTGTAFMLKIKQEVTSDSFEIEEVSE